MAYIDKTTMLNSCYADTGDAPGMDPGCKFIAPGEDISTEVANRPHLQLAENCDVLKATIERDIAAPEIISGTTGLSDTNTITIDGSTTAVFVGDAGYSNDQASRDKLCQLTDADGAEMIAADGTEIKCSAIEVSAADVIGTGFSSSASIVFTFSGDIRALTAYRLTIGRRTDVSNLPVDALTNVTVRSSHESPAEVTFKSFKVCAPDTTEGPADFVGAYAISRAITAGEKYLFVRAGTYGPYTSSQDFGGAVVIGEDRATTIIEIDPGYAVSGLERVQDITFTVDGTPTAGNKITLDNGGVMSNVTADGFWLDAISSKEYLIFDNVRAGGYSGVLGVNTNSHNITIRNLEYISEYVGSVTALFSFGSGTYNVSLENVYPDTPGSNLKDVRGISFETGVDRVSVSNAVIEVNDDVGLYLSVASDVTFKNCSFSSKDSPALYLSDNIEHIILDNCRFESDTYTVNVTTALSSASIYFNNCGFVNNATDYYGNYALRLQFRRDVGTNAACVMNNCYIEDKYAKGNNSDFSPGGSGTAPTAAFPAILLKGVTGSNLRIDRGSGYYLIQNSPGIQLDDCMIDGLRVFMHNVTPYLYVGGGTDLADGYIHVVSGSIINNLYVRISSNGDQEFKVPFVHVEGETSLAGQTGKRSVVNGCTFVHPAGARFIAGIKDRKALVILDHNSTMRGFLWHKEQYLRFDATTHALIQIVGSHVLFEDYVIWTSDSDATYKEAVENLIDIGTTDTSGEGQGAIIRHGRIYVESSGSYPVTGIRSTQGYGCTIDGNIIVWDGDMVAGHYPIYSNIYSNVVGNMIRVYGDLSSNNILIQGGSSVSVASGNILVRDSDATGSGTPAISSTMIGYNTMNVLREAATPDYPAENWF